MYFIKTKDHILIMLSVKYLIKIVEKCNMQTNSCFKRVSSKTDIFKINLALYIQLFYLTFDTTTFLLIGFFNHFLISSNIKSLSLKINVV